MDGEKAVYRTVPHLKKQILHAADAEFPFLHDTMVAPLSGRLFAAWYNCTEDEIAGRTVIRGRWSADGGESWSEPEIVAEDLLEGRHMVPATFLEEDGQIEAYVTKMAAHDRPLGYVVYRYDGRRWVARAEYPVPVLFNTLPQCAGERWYMAGRMAKTPGGPPLIPIVARREAGRTDSAWQIVPLPGPWQVGAFPLACPETALLIDGTHMEAFTRNETGPFWLFDSEDGGETWSPPVDCCLPFANAKICAGRLPDGRQYLIYNERTAERLRTRLVLALRGRSGLFDTRYILADGFDEALQAGPYWHYPCACFDGERMHVSCTVSGQGVRRHAGLFSFPAAAL